MTDPTAARKVPIFNAMDEAVAATQANTSVIYVPPAFAAGAVMEAADSGVSFVVAITEDSVLDMSRARVCTGPRCSYCWGRTAPA